MKSIKEKQLLVKWSKAMNEPIDPALLQEVERYETLQKQIMESVKSNSINDLNEASKVVESIVQPVVVVDYYKPPTLDEVLSVLQEEIQQVEEVIKEEPAQDLVTKATELIAKEAKLEEKASFQQPNPPLVEKNLDAIQKKLKFLEQAIGKIAATGPGSGEVEFRRLDDVDKASFANRDTHKILRYKPNANPAYDSVYFDFLSGDQGPIYSLKFDETGYTGNANVAAGLVSWNSNEDCLDIYQADGSVLQTGLENYIRVFNNTANTFANGTFVEFTGVDAEGDAPTFRAYVNNANAQPLYSIGVLTTDIASNTHGRATVLGLVRGLNTTGNTVGEVWSQGDLLWANPSYPGKYTKFKPTAPNVALSVAAVTVADPTNGIILVRPTIWPRLYYGDFFSSLPQTAAAPNQDARVRISNVLISSGFTLSGNVVTAQQSGLYKFQIRIQLTSTSANQKSIITWFKKNGTNIPYSAVRQSVSENGGYRTITNVQVISMNAQDNVTVHFSVNDTALLIDSPPVFDGAPNIPSLQLTVTQAAL